MNPEINNQYYMADVKNSEFFSREELASKSSG
jgi:hypothetical protein